VSSSCHRESALVDSCRSQLTLNRPGNSPTPLLRQVCKATFSDLQLPAVSHALVLSGDGEIFLGAEAHGEMKIKGNALEGLEIAIAAGAFAGFKANVSGAFAFDYGGNKIASVEASAGVTFGAGGEFSAKLSAPIFGPTTFAIEANVAVGLEVNTDIEVAIDFNEAALAASQSLRQVVYWRTMAKDWDSSLMDQDAKNLFYLKRAIARLEAELTDMTAKIESFNAVPMEERSPVDGMIRPCSA
jgi:hypothetical protein